MSLSVIIPTLNEAAHIEQAVTAAQALGAADVIVADGGSTDATVTIAKRLGAKLVSAPQGRGQQLNAGASVATGDVFLFLHADTWLAPEASHQITAALSAPDVVHGCFRQQISAEGFAYRLLEKGNAFRARTLGTPYGDQGVFVRRSAYEQVAGFPNEPLMEDVTIARRLRRLGRPMLLDGPVHLSARRWQENGIVRQTLRNWLLLMAWWLGVPPRRLARWYPSANPTPLDPAMDRIKETA